MCVSARIRIEAAVTLRGMRKDKTRKIERQNAYIYICMCVFVPEREVTRTEIRSEKKKVLERKRVAVECAVRPAGRKSEN